jgi:hypothetical protein
MRVRLHDGAGVLEQLAAIRAQRQRQDDRRQVAATPLQGGQLAVFAHPLEAGHHRHHAVGQRLPQPAGMNPLHLSPAVGGRNPDAGLGAREGAGRDAARLEAQCQQRGGQQLAGDESAIGLARWRGRLAVARLVQHPALVGEQGGGHGEDRIGHPLEGGYDHHRSQAGGTLASDDVDGRGDVRRATQDRAAELVDDDRRLGGRGS